MPATIQQQRPESKGVGDFFDILFKGAQLGTAFAQLGQQKQKLEEDKRQFDIGKKLESINLTLETVGGDDPVERKKAFETMKPMIIEMMSLGKNSNETKVKGMMDELEKNADMSYSDRLLTIAKVAQDFDFNRYEQLKEQAENPPAQEQAPMEAGPPLSAVMPSGDVGAGYVQKNDQYLANIDRIRASGASEKAKGVAITNQLNKMEPLPPATYAAKVEAYTAQMRNNPELLLKRLAIIGGSDPTRPEYTQAQVDKGMEDLGDLLMNTQTRSTRINARVQAEFGAQRIAALENNLDVIMKNAELALRLREVGLKEEQFKSDKEFRTQAALLAQFDFSVKAALADSTMQDRLNTNIKEAMAAYTKALKEGGYKEISDEATWVKARRNPAIANAYDQMTAAIAAKEGMPVSTVKASIQPYSLPVLGWVLWKGEETEYPLGPTPAYPGGPTRELPGPQSQTPQTNVKPGQFQEGIPKKTPGTESEFEKTQNAIESQIY